jgi:hypothetical protein
MSQLIRCTTCTAELGRINTSTLQVYQMEEKQAVHRKDPSFKASDRKQVKSKVKDGKGIETEVTTEEPNTITCKCGCVNKIY